MADGAEPASWAHQLSLIDPAAWQGLPVPAREWAWHEQMPLRQTTYLTGAGSTGKSLLGQQLATCAAMGLPCLGVETRRTTALYLTCEDDAEELHRRQEDICYALQLHLSDLAGRLLLATMVAEELGNELCTFERNGPLQTTSAWDRLCITVHERGIGLLVLDNASHLFGGDEINRGQVAAFLGLLNGLAAEANCAILLVGHPNKRGEPYSGSTAWENQVRSRLFLERPAADGGFEDPDVRRLSRGKANYTRKGEAIDFRWWRWAFLRDVDLPAEQGGVLAAQRRTEHEEARFLACLAKATEERRATKHLPGSNYAPKLFADMPEAQGLSQVALVGAMKRLFSASVIRADQPLWKGADRHWRAGLKLASECGDPPAGTPCGDPR